MIVYRSGSVLFHLCSAVLNILDHSPGRRRLPPKPRAAHGVWCCRQMVLGCSGGIKAAPEQQHLTLVATSP
ncbi:hypothetical protein E2C01_041427 [Portunus trituberculatus]|uniref:Uncharacterized protein n=1 Tax=Portunus trituberculatus TaxID=210409 RepID=A0A5B7FTJ4_PORTR|nr:hypothetical protein [Portunus trituberculatus]